MSKVCHGLKNCLCDGVRAGKKACVLRLREGCRDGLQNSCERVGDPGIVTKCALPCS